MAVHLTEEQARRFGFKPAKKSGGSKKKSMPRGTVETRCATCGVLCPGETAEKRHNDETHHGRFEVVL